MNLIFYEIEQKCMQKTLEKQFIHKQKGGCFESRTFLNKKNRLSQMQLKDRN